MPIKLSCSCGKALNLKDELAGRRIKCPACAGVLTVPVPEPEIVETALIEESGDAPLLDEPDDTVRTKPKKKKKVRKTDVTPLTKKEKREMEFERESQRRWMVKRMVTGMAYIVLGGILFAGCLFGIIWYRMELWAEPKAGLAIIFGLLMGLAAIGKGILGMLFGQFVGDEG